MKFSRRLEATAVAWMWRIILGPAMLLDGAVVTASVGALSIGASLAVSKRLAIARVSGMMKAESKGDA